MLQIIFINLEVLSSAFGLHLLGKNVNHQIWFSQILFYRYLLNSLKYEHKVTSKCRKSAIFARCFVK